jgi:hypothetical protein
VATEEQDRKAVALADRSAWNHDYLGVILTAVHKYEEAVQEFRKSLDIWPDSRLVYCHLGDALLRLHQDADAEAAYKRALTLDVNYYLANLRMGKLRQMQGHQADARRYVYSGGRSDNTFVLHGLTVRSAQRVLTDSPIMRGTGSGSFSDSSGVRRVWRGRRRCRREAVHTVVSTPDGQGREPAGNGGQWSRATVAFVASLAM